MFAQYRQNCNGEFVSLINRLNWYYLFCSHLGFFVFQSRGDYGHRRNGNGMYYGTPFYGGYGYASPVAHPNMYAAAYGAYPYYGNQQLVS